MGSVDNKHMIRKAVLGNTFLVQVQSIVVGLLASFVACIVDLIQVGKVDVDNLLVLIVTSMVTASLASSILGKTCLVFTFKSNQSVVTLHLLIICHSSFCTLGFIMIGIILLSKKFHVNPDNIATPIAASLGDVVTLVILAWIGTVLYDIS